MFGVKFVKTVAAYGQTHILYKVRHFLKQFFWVQGTQTSPTAQNRFLYDHCNVSVPNIIVHTSISEKVKSQNTWIGSWTLWPVPYTKTIVPAAQFYLFVYTLAPFKTIIFYLQKFLRVGRFYSTWQFHSLNKAFIVANIWNTRKWKKSVRDSKKMITIRIG